MKRKTRRTKRSPFEGRNVAKNKAVKLEEKLKKQTMKAGATAKKLRKALAQQEQASGANSSISNTTPS